MPITNDSLPCSWPVSSAQLRSYQHALDWVPYPLVMRLSRRLACVNQAAAAAVLTIWLVRGTPLTRLEYILRPTHRSESEQGRRSSPVPSRTELGASPARHTRAATFGVRQPSCRSSRAHNPALGTPLTRLEYILRPTHRSESEQGRRSSPVPSRAKLGASPARHTRAATFGVRQPSCRSSRAHNPALGTPLTRLVTEMLNGISTIRESVRKEGANYQETFLDIGSTFPSPAARERGQG